MIEKFYTIKTNVNEVDCLSTEEIYLRLITARFSVSKANAIRELVSLMKPCDCLVFDDSGAGFVEIRTWKYDNDQPGARA